MFLLYPIDLVIAHFQDYEITLAFTESRRRHNLRSCPNLNVPFPELYISLDQMPNSIMYGGVSVLVMHGPVSQTSVNYDVAKLPRKIGYLGLNSILRIIL